ncbi:MAG: hypothetical protein AAF633_28590, partial [Chloroflexota bacterium]
MLEFKHSKKLLLSAIGLGILTDILFYNQSLGISLPLFVLLSITSLEILGSETRISVKMPRPIADRSNFFE